MVIIWRIGTDTPTYVAEDLSGRGAETTGGRWNKKGTPMLYASSSRALACLETLVHLAGGDPLPLNRYLVELTVPDGLWKTRAVFDPTAHVGWDAEPAGKISIDWGDEWARSGASLLAEVPSVVVPEETNIIVNPAHVDISRIAIKKRRRWTYDIRLG
jgi:RES domain-containing protein